jgi:hypothetical protein
VYRGVRRGPWGRPRAGPGAGVSLFSLHCIDAAGFVLRMLIPMRITLVIDDGLLRQAKHRAAERNLTVSDVVNEALREAFRQSAAAAPPFSMITYGGSEERIHDEPADFGAALEEEDLSRLR